MGARHSTEQSPLTDIDYPIEEYAWDVEKVPFCPELRTCGCHRVYRPASSSKPFNDTPRNRAAIVDIIPKLTSFEVAVVGNWRNTYAIPGTCLWIKACSDDGLAEASTMRWVSAHSSVPVPRVIAAIPHGDKVYIIMEAIRGRSLRETWYGLSNKSQERVCAQLKVMIDELRAIPPPNTRYANVDGGSLNAGPIYVNLDDPAPAEVGPCETFAALDHQLSRYLFHFDIAHCIV